MTLRDIFLQATSHPEPTPDWAIDRVADMAVRHGARLSLGICQVQLPSLSNWLANKLLSVDSIIADENRKSTTNVEAIISRFTKAVPPELLGEISVIDTNGMAGSRQLTITARTHDLIIVPVHEHSRAELVAEDLIFESGRPVLLLPETHPPVFDSIAIAWDGGRAAARALADALPLCRQASSVAVVQVTGEKDLFDTTPVSAAIRHLADHGIDAVPIEITLDDEDAARTLQSFAVRNGRDLLVMGGFGQSRTREFILGGVTRSVLDNPKLPTLISH